MAVKVKTEQEAEEKVKLPEGTNAAVESGMVTITGKGMRFSRKFDAAAMSVSLVGNELVFAFVGKKTRRKAAKIGAIVSHVKNAFKGISSPFTKKLQIVYSHFPVSIEVNGKEIAIKNFLGEKVPRIAKAQGDVKIEVKGQEVTVTGHDKEDVGQTANNLIRATSIRGKDRRIFQDGIYYAI